MTACVDAPATNGCRGYPQRRGSDGRNIRLHREAMEQHLGRTLSPDEHVIRLCHNKLCVRVDHLRVGTHAEAMGLMVEAGRSARGERNGHARLTEQDVRAVRAFARLGYSNERLAASLGCTASNIKKIVARKSWRHVA